MYQIEDSSLRLSVFEQEGQILAELSDLHSGVVWGPTPVFTLSVMSILLQRTELMRAPAVRISQEADTLAVTLSVDNQFFSASVTVRFSLENGELVAQVPTDQIQEKRPEVSLLDSVSILPLIRTGPDAPGHLVLPYRTGALCYPERHSRFRESFLIYGEQKRWELMPMLPCCGAVRSQSALMVIVEQGDCDTECQVETDGLGSGEVRLALRYRYTPIDPIDPIDRIMRFVPLRGENAGYAGMGRRLHQFILKKAGRGTLSERAARNPDLAYAAESFVLKIMHASKEIGSLDGSGRLHVYTTCEEAMVQLSCLKQLGIDRLMVQLTGWNLEGHDGRWPTRFPVEPAIGGAAGLRRLIAHGQSLGYQMQVHDNYLDLYQRSDRFDPDLCAGSLYGGPLKRGCWAGGINYTGWPLSYPQSYLDDQMREVQALGPRGIYYLDAMGMPLEISYNEKHGECRYRRACADGVNRVLKTSREIFGSSGTENGYLYCVLESDYIGSPFVGAQSEPVSELIDAEVPLWFMAVKGHVFSNLNDTFTAAIDFGVDSPQTVSRRMLRMAEYGLLPRNEGVSVYGDWGYPLEETLEAMKLEYDLLIVNLPGIGLAALEDHQILEGDSMQGEYVSRSRFSNGIETLCDYGRNRLEINGRDYPLPNDFVKRPALAIGQRSPRAE
ncbi:MAG: DUF5696 domain-containing protein [Janthinobacterium lividum]